jgi:AraC-like DNA-binding protein
MSGGTRPSPSRATLPAFSRFELVRRFREQVGLPPHSFQLDLRIAEARRRKSHSHVASPITRIPMRTFKRAVGVAPGEYARAS